MQTKKHSTMEAFSNIAIGYLINVIAIALIFPFFGITISLNQNLMIGVFFILTSFARSYLLRRFFNKFLNQPGLVTTKPDIKA